MAVEHFIPEGPTPLPEHRHTAGQRAACCSKAGRGRQRSFRPMTLGHWAKSPPLTVGGVSHVHPEQASAPGWKFYIRVSLQDVTGLSRSFCNLDLFFHWIWGPGQRRASSPSGHQLPYRATPPATQAQLKAGGRPGCQWPTCTWSRLIWGTGHQQLAICRKRAVGDGRFCHDRFHQKQSLRKWLSKVMYENLSSSCLWQQAMRRGKKKKKQQTPQVWATANADIAIT